MMRHGCLQSNKRQKGQISILMVFMLIPMFTLFAFVVNIGMLVHAKIQLQNAADLAAYAGAATQARQLNAISHVNYAMRQAYKKFIFKYYVIGSRGLRCYPGRSDANVPGCNNNSPNFDWVNPGGNNFPGMPVVCIYFSSDSNTCQIGTPIRVVREPPCNSVLDPTCRVLQDAARQIAQVQRLSCDAQTGVNSEVLMNWLYATDFGTSLQTNTNLDGLVSDIGLVTENLINFERIKTITNYVNIPAQEMTQAVVNQQMENAADPVEFERSIMAFRTAINNLNNDVFEMDTVSLKELIPSNGMLNVTPFRVPFKAGFTYMKGNDNTTAGAGSGDCGVFVQLVDAAPILGVNRAPNSYVYYAVKLTARAQLLFNPFPFGRAPDARIDLTAYSAAAPFGSRIGPQLQASDFVVNRQVTVGEGQNENVPVPRLLIDPAAQLDWEKRNLLTAYNNFLTSNSTLGSGSLDTQDVERGIRAALMPERSEVGKYNIPVDTDRIGVSGEAAADTESHEFISYYRHGIGNNPAYTFWAPVVAPGAGINQFQDNVRSELDNIINSIGECATTGDQVICANKTAVKDLLLQRLGGLLSSLSSRKNFRVMRIIDPLGEKFFDNNGPAPNGALIDAAGKITNKTALATSFTTDHDEFYFQNGRTGYSVKFIPFRMLISEPGRLSNVSGGETRWPSQAPNFRLELSDLQSVAH